MLRPLDLTELPPPPAYRVPWRVLRNDPQHPIIVNDGRDSADFVRIFHDDGGATGPPQLWGQVLPAEQIELCLCAVDTDNATVTLAWFRQTDGLEYVWRFVV